MTGLRLDIAFFFFSLLLTSESGPGMYREDMESNKGRYNSEINNLSARSISDQLPNDSVYHAGALLVMDLNMKARSLKSNFCLSCHDGIVASTGHTSSNVGNLNTIDASGIFNFDHPVAFEFTRELAFSKSYLNDPYTTPSGLGGTIAEDLLVEGRIECVTCHNIFFKTENQQQYEILNKSNSGSSLCFTCHNR